MNEQKQFFYVIIDQSLLCHKQNRRCQKTMLIDLKTIKTVPRLILELNVLFNFVQPAQSTCTEGNSNNCSASSLVIIFPASGPYI